MPLANRVAEVNHVGRPMPAACLRIDDVLTRRHAHAFVCEEDRRQRLLPDASLDVERLPRFDVDVRRKEVDAPVEPLLVTCRRKMTASAREDVCDDGVESHAG